MTRTLTKVLFSALKHKKTKSSQDNIEENLHFKQLRLKYINKQKDDEICVLNAIKIYSYISFVFSTISNKVKLLKILKVL